ncbi:MAG TPA: hypothetical protein VG603_10880 [Chitinophagales bacterium]|nr:hypothetical protein [Chitinophagales bacterium]
MKSFSFIVFLVCFSFGQVYAQTYLGLTKAQILALHKDCTQMDNYGESLVLNCYGSKTIYYFSGTEGGCDMYAFDVPQKNALDTVNKLLGLGFKNTETRYVEPFLKLGPNDHHKYPSHIYSDGKIQYCIMPVALSGKTANLNAIIIMYNKAKK